MGLTVSFTHIHNLSSSLMETNRLFSRFMTQQTAALETVGEEVNRAEFRGGPGGPWYKVVYSP
jgi:hypothetical protein